MLASIVFSLAIIAATLGSRTFSFGIVSAALIFAGTFGLLELSAICFVAIFMAYNLYLLKYPPKQVWLKVCLYFIWASLSAALILHMVPGFNNSLIVDQLAIKSNSSIQSFYWNLDKILVAWSITLFIPIWRKSNEPVSLIKPIQMIGVVLLGFLVMFGLAILLGLAEFQFEWFVLLPVLLAANLINTCIAEELLFRGLIQSFFVRKFGLAIGLLAAALIFGIAHFGGGIFYILIATLAGLVYGLVYIVSGRIYWAILTHFTFNALHMIFFTYPLLA